MRICVSVGERIREKRQEIGMKQKSLADKVGISPQHLYQYESDRRVPKLDMLTKIADALGTTAEHLLGNEVDMTIEELINRINAHRDPDPDSDWKYGKDYGIMVALKEIERYRKDNEVDENEGRSKNIHKAT